mmetsp:Transcript_60316/g.186715  ORF Transcript_60316/g.186715 Transcript_60316/m.186715 type:complete len:244 (+) Transcript_60316:809-1540(+)
MGEDPGTAEKVKAYYSLSHAQLPWGWKSARDPESGMDYYWPANDRAAVTWDRPSAPPAGMTPPTPPKAVVQTTTPPPPFEVKSAKGGWSRCNVLGNGTKPGTFNITVRTGLSTWMQLGNIPGTAIRNITDNATLLTNETFREAVAAAKALLPKVGDSMEVKTKSNSWVPCLVTGLGNETDTYNVHVPFAPAGHQDHANVHISILRKVTDFGRKDTQAAGNASNATKADDKADGKADVVPHSQA